MVIRGCYPHAEDSPADSGTVVRQLLALAITATVSARVEDASVLRGVVRNTVGGGFALAVTFAIGHLVSMAVS